MQTHTLSGSARAQPATGTGPGIATLPTMAPPVGNNPLLRAIQLPYSHTEWATLHAAFPLDEAAWDQMMKVLEAMKPVLIKPATAPVPQPPEPVPPPASREETEPVA